MRIKKGEVQVFSISFLDVLSCALGAVIILLVVVPKSPPKPEAESNIIQTDENPIIVLDLEINYTEYNFETEKTQPIGNLKLNPKLIDLENLKLSENSKIKIQNNPELISN